jgi:hypothetical protein
MINLIPAGKRLMLALCLTFLLGLLAPACATMPAAQGTEPAEALTPTTTPDVLGISVISSPACLTTSWSTIQTNKLQGDLIAWDSTSERLAYVAPIPSSSWYVGALTVTTSPDFTEHTPLAPNVTVIGDVTWSPDSERIAFVALRGDESVQTVMVARVSGRDVSDLLPLDQAGTTSSSQKAVISWLDSNQVRVMSSCAEDCQQALDANLSSGEVRPFGEQERWSENTPFTPGPSKTLDGLQPELNEVSFDAALFPKYFNSPNWSPDRESVVYLDRRGLLWLLRVSDKTQYLLDLGLRFVNETKWSPDGKRVAVRAEDRIFMFEVPCITR